MTEKSGRGGAIDATFRFWASVSSIVGLAVVVATSFDVMVTVLSVGSGPGPITKRVSAAAWRLFRGAHMKIRRSHWLLRSAGPLIVLAIVLTWFLLMILGWGLVFGQEGSLVADGEVIQPALGRIHYASELVLGGGSSELQSGKGVWRFAEQLAVLTGVAFIGVSVAYVLPVIGAVAHRRSVAATIATLGGNPNEILLRAWTGDDFGDLDLHLIGLTPEITLASQRLLAYPVITYFHSDDRVSSMAPALVVLDEALTLLEEAVDGDAGCGRGAIVPCRAALTNFLGSLARMGIRPPGDNVLPRPPLEPLRSAGIPLREVDRIRAGYDELEDRRGRWAAYLRHDAAHPNELQASVPSEDVDEESRGDGDSDGRGAADAEVADEPREADGDPGEDTPEVDDPEEVEDVPVADGERGREERRGVDSGTS